MRLKLDVNKLKHYLNTSPDSEMIARDEYVADIFSAERPLTLNIRICDAYADVIAAAYLLYDAELDGWYMGERTENEQEIASALEAVMADD